MIDPRALLTGLLQIYSPSYQEHGAVDYLVAQMNALGLHALRDEAGNAVGITSRQPSHSKRVEVETLPRPSADSREGEKEIVLLGHIDTHPGVVQVRREGDLLFGRGAVDAKGPLCAFAAAAARARIGSDWRVVVVGAVEEECPTSKGAHFAKTQYQPAFAIVGEPSGWDRVTLGYKGSLWLDYVLQRDNAHSAGQARSANEEAVEFWLKVKAFADEFNATKSKIFDRLDPTLRGMHSENDGLHESARLTIGLRLPLEVTVAGLEETMLELAGDARIEFSTETPAYRAEKNNGLVRAFLAAIREQGGVPGFTLKTGTSDMNVVGPYWNCPVVTYGPGDSNLDHTPNEHIDLNEYDRAIDVLAGVLETLTH
jgi:[amino group carrier protein]-lysine/ornithine hydrolase